MKRLIFVIFLVPYFIYGQNWQKVENGVSWASRTMITYNNKLHIGKQHVQGTQAPIGIWNNQNWDSLYLNCNPYGIYTLAVFQNKLFTTSCRDGIDGYDGIQWKKFATTNDYVDALKTLGNELYALGMDSLNGVATPSRVAKWDGLNWTIFDTTKFSIFVDEAEFYKGDLYIGGNFSNYNGSLTRLARWDGSKWNKVGNLSFGGFGGVNKMIVYKDELYVGGLIRSGLGPGSGSGIFRWNGTRWDDLQGGTGVNSNGQIFDMKIFNDELYVVGSFTDVGGIPAFSIAKWDGYKWCSLGSVLDNIILALEVYNDELYIGGGFKTIDGITSYNYIAKWVGDDYIDTCTSVTNINEYSSFSFSLFPNPTLQKLNLLFSQTIPTNSTVNIISRFGQIIFSYVIPSGEVKSEIDVSQLSIGMYFITFQNEAGIWSKKFIKE